MMSVHSNGGQLFWQPGAYIANGRITTPRPPLGHESFYWQSANRILSQVRATPRQTVVTPENVGGSSDVLYSSAGNVREDMYFNYGIFAFGWEVGGSVYNPATGNFQDGSFQPPWVGTPDLVSGHSETMEYSNGVIEMFRIAADFGRDKTPATSTLTPARAPVRLADRGEVRDQRAGDRLLHDRRLGADDAVAALQADRVPRAAARSCGSTRPRRSSGSRSTPRATSSRRAMTRTTRPRRTTTASTTIKIGEEGGVGGTVPATLSLALGTAGDVPPFVPGVAREYEASTTANVISTAGDAHAVRLDRPAT